MSNPKICNIPVEGLIKCMLADIAKLKSADKLSLDCDDVVDCIESNLKVLPLNCTALTA